MQKLLAARSVELKTFTTTCSQVFIDFALVQSPEKRVPMPLVEGYFRAAQGMTTTLMIKTASAVAQPHMAQLSRPRNSVGSKIL